MALYMSKSYFNEVFNCQDGYFNGYFSNRKITDLKDDYIASTISPIETFNSQYIHIKSLPKKGVYISKDVADKYNLKKGDRISLKESYKDLRYTFEI